MTLFVRDENPVASCSARTARSSVEKGAGSMVQPMLRRMRIGARLASALPIGIRPAR
jgi:hypothetical protein